MKILRIALILNFALMANISHALEMPDVDIRVDYPWTILTIPTNGQTQLAGFPQFNLGGGASLSISGYSPSWGVWNRVNEDSVSLINGINNGGSIQLTSPGSIVISGSIMPDTRISLSASAVPEANTYAMLLTGLGLISAIVGRRKAK